MKQSTLEKLRAPGAGEKLELVSGDLNNGELKSTTRKFPIIDGIPRLLHEDFDRYTSQSFSAEWKELKNEDDVWGRPIDERMGELELLELPLEQLKGKEFLDVGCGNALFARAVATRYGAHVSAMDISRGLETAKRLTTPQDSIDFIQADAQFPPFAPGSFDIIWGAGSIHHTPNPRKTFKALVPLLKKGGRIFLWLYTPPREMTFRLRARYLIKEIVCRMPAFLQNAAIFLIGCFTFTKQFILHKIFKKELRVPFVPKLRHHRMMARDTFTVRYDYRFTTDDLLAWHKENGLKTIYSKYVELKDGPWLAALAEKV